MKRPGGVQQHWALLTLLATAATAAVLAGIVLVCETRDHADDARRRIDYRSSAEAHCIDLARQYEEDSRDPSQASYANLSLEAAARSRRNAEFHGAMRRKWETAVWRPWAAVEHDPPQP